MATPFFPLIGMNAPSIGMQPQRPSWQARLFDRLVPSQTGEGLEDRDKQALVRQGLLQLAAGIQSSPNFGQGLTQGLTGGLLSLGEGAQDLQNQRYQRQLMDRTLAGAQRNQQIEELQGRLARSPNPLQSPEYQQYAVFDPQGARALREAVSPQTRYALGELGTPEGGTVPVFFNPERPGEVLDVSGRPVFGQQMPQGGAQPQIFGNVLNAAVEQVESGGNPYAVSPKGAIGPMQTMPGTLTSPGFGVAPARDASIAEQRRVGQDYLAAMTQKYGPVGGLAAYNWGPSNWEAALQRSGGDPQRALAMAPRETQAYVPNVLNRVQGASGLASLPGYTPPKRSDTRQFRRLSPEEVVAAGYPAGAVVQADQFGNEDVKFKPETKDQPGGGKALGMGTINKLAKEAGRAENLSNLITRFQPDFAGNVAGGGAENLVGRLGGEALGLATEGQADWWQQYDKHKNEVRNELFGASLTAGEKAAFEASDVNPNMAPEKITANLSVQNIVIQRALHRQAKTWAAQGYNRDAIQEVTGVDLSQPPPELPKPKQSMAPRSTTKPSGLTPAEQAELDQLRARFGRK